MDSELGLETVEIDNASKEYVGKWTRLVSTTNWEKGRIIHEWRQALVDAGAASTQYSDEAWSRRVAHVSGQHVGRLRRVYERFGSVRETYDRLFWSHFQVALDWSDAEMWLEGAVQSDWSISEMRAQRHEAFGGDASDTATDEDGSSELDEDFQALEGATVREVRDAGPAAEAFDVEDSDARENRSRTAEADDESDDAPTAEPFDADDDLEPVATNGRGTFEHLADLPADLAEALEAFKLAVIRHKLAGWHEVSRSDVLACLDGLRELALAPS